MVKILPIRVEPTTWRSLWGDITRADLERLDAVIKDRTLSFEEARRQAQIIKRQPPFIGTAMTVNPKIDSKTQRRLQCSLSFSDVIKILAPDADPRIEEKPTLWGVVFPGMVD